MDWKESLLSFCPTPRFICVTCNLAAYIDMLDFNKPLPPLSTYNDRTPPALPQRSDQRTKFFVSAIDGPPSPTKIRAYTEQLKMSGHAAPIIPNTGRNEDVALGQSTTPSFKSSSTNSEQSTLSRQASATSSVNRSQRLQRERPESVINFGKGLFSRAKRAKRDTSSHRTTSSMSNHIDARENSRTVYSKEQHHGGRNKSASIATETPRPIISEPFNFQHVTHTRQEHLPCLQKTTPQKLISEFSAIRASQTPLEGHLKGIRVEEIQKRNTTVPQVTPSNAAPVRPHTGHPRSRENTLTSAQNPLLRPVLQHARSYDNFTTQVTNLQQHVSSASPIRPPVRTSSRAASMIWNSWDTINGFTLEKTSPAMDHNRKKQSFHLPISEPLVIKHSTDDYFCDQPSGQRTPEVEQWPLPTPELDSPKQSLAKVPEEDDDHQSKPSQSLFASSAGTMPFPRESQVFDLHVPRTIASENSQPASSVYEEDQEITNQIADLKISTTRQKDSPKLSHETWEDDIDYCYEHEVEADCEYDWDRCSMEDSNYQSLESSASGIASNSDKDWRTRPTLLVPSHIDLPSLSPTNSSAMTPRSVPEPITPLDYHRPTHLRSPSQASSFKESHGFTLSPSLLIPTDYTYAMMELSHSASDDHLTRLTETNNETLRSSPKKGTDRSSTVSSSTYQSSAFSHSSNMSFTTTVSTSTTQLPKSHSQDSLWHNRSLTTTTSFPELIPHYRRAVHQEKEECAGTSTSPAIPAIQPRRRTTSSTKSFSLYPSASAPMIPHPITTSTTESALSPVQEVPPIYTLASPAANSRFEALMEAQKDLARIHERKTSAPLLSSRSVDGSPKARRKRAQSSVSKPKGNYGLFPVS